MSWRGAQSPQKRSALVYVHVFCHSKRRGPGLRVVVLSWSGFVLAPGAHRGSILDMQTAADRWSTICHSKRIARGGHWSPGIWYRLRLCLALFGSSVPVRVRIISNRQATTCWVLWAGTLEPTVFACLWVGRYYLRPTFLDVRGPAHQLAAGYCLLLRFQGHPR